MPRRCVCVQSINEDAIIIHGDDDVLTEVKAITEAITLTMDKCTKLNGFNLSVQRSEAIAPRPPGRPKSNTHQKAMGELLSLLFPYASRMDEHTLCLCVPDVEFQLLGSALERIVTIVPGCVESLHAHECVCVPMSDPTPCAAL